MFQRMFPGEGDQLDGDGYVTLVIFPSSAKENYIGSRESKAITQGNRSLQERHG